MLTRYAAIILTSAFFLVAPSVAQAQNRWSLELLPGVAFATEDAGQAEIDFGVGADATIGYRVMPHLSVYGGWGWREFGAHSSFSRSDVDLAETGYLFGLRFEHPMGDDDAPELVVRLGGTYNHLEIEDGDGAIVSDSGHGLGFEVGAGVAFRLGDRWRVTPGVRFRSTEREFDELGVTVPAPLRYMAIDLAFSRRF